MINRDNRSIARENRVLFTSYLVENGYGDPFYIGRFWGVSSNTAKIYIKEAQYVTLANSDIEKLQSIQNSHNCDLPTAIEKQYERLSNSSCFIATAAYGSPFTYDIDILRHWRNNALYNNYLGTRVVDFYYKHSPPIAEVIKNRKTLRFVVRQLLKPFVLVLRVKYKMKL